MISLQLKQIKKALRSWKWVPIWIKNLIPVGQQISMLRCALGMTQGQLAKFMKTSQRAIVRLEKEEGDPQLSTLGRIAESLNCELIIRFVPKTDLEDFLKAKAKSKAERLVKMSIASANIELQKPSQQVVQSEIRRLTEEILNKRRSVLWES